MENENSEMAQTGFVIVNSVRVLADSFEPDESNIEISEEV